MSQPNITCTVCGSYEFTVDSGFYFCLECNTQSQDVRELVFDEYFGNQKATTRVLQKKITKTTSSGPNERLTSWEVLNYILKGITDELMDLGAKQDLKIVTLQLWASYLRKLDVAFTSVEIEQKPKLGYAFKRSDAEIIYGVTEKQLRGKSWRSRSRLKSTSVSSCDSVISCASASGGTRRSILRKLSIWKKALASAEYSQLSQPTSVSYNQTLEGLDLSSDVTETPRRLKLTRYAKGLLSSSYASSANDGLSERRKLLRKEMESVRNVTVAKIAALSNLALAMTSQDIQVCDFLRWVEEGHVSLETSQKFLPEGTKLEPQIQRMLELGHLSYTACQSLMVRLCSELDIMALPPPNLGRLAERYCLELQLPGDLVDLVKRILNLISDKNYENPPSAGKSCEAKTMAVIVVALKLLFSLDDCTEYSLSHTATQLNRVLENEFFVFTDWMKFIECRKAVVSAYHLPTRTAVYGDTIGRDSELFMKHYSQIMDQQPNCREISKRYALNKTWVEAMTWCLHKLSEHQPQPELFEHIHFPASLTPLHSYCQLLLSSHAERVAVASAVLSQDFTSHSLDYILASDRTMALGLADGMNIVQRSEGAAAIFKVKNIDPKNGVSTTIPRFKINQANITVGIVKNIISVQKKYDESETNSLDEDNWSENYSYKKNTLYREAKEIISDDSDEEESNHPDEDYNKFKNTEVPTCHTVLQLFDTASQYWCIHCNLSKNKMNNDEFDVFAMKTFPSNFLWLINECSRMVYVSTKDLYANIVAIEKKIHFILHSVNQGQKRKR